MHGHAVGSSSMVNAVSSSPLSLSALAGAVATPRDPAQQHHLWPCGAPACVAGPLPAGVPHQLARTHSLLNCCIAVTTHH